MKRSQFKLGMWIVAWILFLNQMVVLAFVWGLSMLVYDYIFIRKINVLRLFISTIALDGLAYIVVGKELLSVYSSIFPFLLLMNLNVASLSEDVAKYKKAIFNIYFFHTAILLLGLFTFALLIPDSRFVPCYKDNLYQLISIIVLPLFLNLLIIFWAKYFPWTKQGRGIVGLCDKI